MSESSCNFFINSAFNANFDITWSFGYNLSGGINSTGGFSTFLFNNPTLIGGGAYEGLGFSPYQSRSGVTGAVLGVMIDSNDTVTIKKGTTFTTITSFAIFPMLSSLIKPNNEFDTIRFNFTNCAQTLKIAAKNKETNRYVKLASINTGISALDTDFYRIGFGYSAPLNSGEGKAIFNIKDIHIQGNTSVPTTIYRPRPEIEDKIETFYIIQSPLSGHIDIGNPDPTSVGSLMHKSK
jgi:hypothetical protein